MLPVSTGVYNIIIGERFVISMFHLGEEEGNNKTKNILNVVHFFIFFCNTQSTSFTIIKTILMLILNVVRNSGSEIGRYRSETQQFSCKRLNFQYLLCEKSINFIFSYINIIVISTIPGITDPDITGAHKNTLYILSS